MRSFVPPTQMRYLTLWVMMEGFIPIYNKTALQPVVLSSHDPNLQNIPISGEDGLALRKLFIAPDGWTLVSIDYSQMELRLAAILSGEKGLLKIFKENGDIHTSVASQVLGVPEDAVTADQRASAKAINFGILYGMGAQSLRQTLKVSFADAERFLAEYKKAFPMLFTYFDSVKKQALSSGFVTTAFGRVRPIEGASSSLQFVRSQAERMAVNSVVQGTAADIIKLAMVGVDAMIQERALGDQVRMVLQIHDELLFEIRPDVVDSVVGDIITIMESVYPPNQTPIQLTANAKKGQSWGFFAVVRGVLRVNFLLHYIVCCMCFVVIVSLLVSM